MAIDETTTSRRRFARGVLLGLPLVAATELASDPAEAAATSWHVGGNALSAVGVLGTTTTADLSVVTANKERLRVLAAGTVGVGTATPVALLHVHGSARAQPVLQVDQPSHNANALVVNSAATTGQNAITAALTASDPGAAAAGVYAEVQTTQSSDGTAVWGYHQSTGRGVYGLTAAGGTGVTGETGAYNGLGGLFYNQSLGPNQTPGAALRGLAAGASYADLHPAGTAFSEAAGEFAGANGIIGSSAGTRAGGIGVIGLGAGNAGYGVFGEAFATDVAGVEGYHPNTGAGVRGLAGGAGVGVYGNCNATTGVGAEFTNRAPSPGAGVRGESGTADNTTIRHAATVLGYSGYAGGEFGGGYGVIGAANGGGHAAGVAGVGPDASGYGVVGRCQLNDFAGVAGLAPSGDGAVGLFGSGDIGAYVQSNQGGGVALSASGDVEISGTLSKSGGSFKIDHPLNPAESYLYHSFVESPDMMNVYNGNVTTDDVGVAVVELPDYFMALNRDFRYQLTVLGQFAQAVVGRPIVDGRFEIHTDRPQVEVSWQVTGIRHDAWAEAHRIPTTVPKNAADRGRYLHPELFSPRARALPHVERARAVAAAGGIQ